MINCSFVLRELAWYFSEITTMKYFLFLLLFLAACKAQPAETPTVYESHPEIENHEWRLVVLGRTPTDIGNINQEITLRFDTSNHIANAFGGCNLMSARYSVTGSGFVFRSGSSTRVICSLIRIENTYFNVLQSADRYVVDESTLVLYDRNRRVAEFRRRDR